MQKSIYFNYISDRYYHFALSICVALFLGSSFLYLYFINDLFNALLAMLITLLVLTSFLLFIHKKIQVTTGLFEFGKKDFSYTTFKNTYSVAYSEIKSIEKKSYTADYFFSKEDSYSYVITLADGHFTFKAYDEELDYAILELAKHAHLEIQ